MPTEKNDCVMPWPDWNRTERQLGALYAIAHVLSTQAGQRTMLAEVLEILQKDLGMVHVTVLLLSTDGDELVVEQVQEEHLPEQKRVSYQRGEGVTGQVLETGKPAVIPRIAEEPRFQGRIHQRGPGAVEDMSFICMPIILGNEVVGALSADLPFEEHAELAESERVLRVVSSMIASDVKGRRTAKARRHALEAENLTLRNALGERFRPENIIGNSGAMRTVYQRIHQVAASDTTVLILGESGTGKELAASAIHYQSPRAKGPFIKVNCAAPNEILLESKLFGHEQGAFTGALRERAGRIEEAKFGTLFLDEIGEFSPSIQIKLLRVLQEREYERVGSNRTRKANARIIAATNVDLESAVKTGAFRSDLFYRVNVFPILLPPLRERKSDILLLADYFVEKLGKSMRKKAHRISTTAINMMMAYHWPGNVRELENCIEHAVLLSTDGVIDANCLPPALQIPRLDDGPSAGTLKARVRLLERELIMDALKMNNGSVRAAAGQLGITPRMVRYKMVNMGIDHRHYTQRK